MTPSEMLAKALVLATVAHDGQYDRGGNPYILHPLKVMHYLKTDDCELMSIALIHDVIEDKRRYNGELVTWKMLADLGFSDRVINGAKSVTKLPGETEEEYKTKVFSNIDGMLVKREDIRHNSDIRRLKNKTVTEKDIARIVKYHKFYLEIEEKLGEAK